MQNIDFSFAQDPNTLSLAIIYGMIPAILWIFYWLREDTEHARRKGLLIALFFTGVISVIFTLPIQKFIFTLSTDENILNILWAASEELVKFLVFAVIILRSTDDTIIDPVDYPLYIMVAALGFAGFENALYFLSPLQAGDTAGIVLSGSMRFVGTTLLHAATSSIIGIAIGFAYFKSKRTAVLYAFVGIALSIAAHSAFNHYIVQNDQRNFMQVFTILWLFATVIMVLLETLRKMGSIETRRKKEHAFFLHIEELFKKVLTMAGLTEADTIPIAESLKKKNFSESSREYKTFMTLISSLRSLYSGFMISEGADKKKVGEISVQMIPETIAPNAVAAFVAKLKGEVEHELEVVGGKVKGVQFASQLKPMAMPSRPVPVAPLPPKPIQVPATPPLSVEKPKQPIEVKVTQIVIPTDFVPVKAGTPPAPARG
ncbi:MAG: PrsW family intramembrane metalloprotease [Candidatus Pacebacteria bacterium]|nr:PrsW family intramembrane metalloprotease [Candidatus Paceibacterota bacterium]